MKTASAIDQGSLAGVILGQPPHLAQPIGERGDLPGHQPGFRPEPGRQLLLLPRDIAVLDDLGERLPVQVQSPGPDHLRRIGVGQAQARLEPFHLPEGVPVGRPRLHDPADQGLVRLGGQPGRVPGRLARRDPQGLPQRLQPARLGRRDGPVGQGLHDGLPVRLPPGLLLDPGRPLGGDPERPGQDIELDALLGGNYAVGAHLAGELGIKLLGDLGGHGGRVRPWPRRPGGRTSGRRAP